MVLLIKGEKGGDVTFNFLMAGCQTFDITTLQPLSQGGHGTGNLAVLTFPERENTGNLVNLIFLHRENCANTGKILKI